MRKRLGEVYRKFEVSGKGPGKLRELRSQLERFATTNQSEQTESLVRSKLQDELQGDVDWGNAPGVPHLFGRDRELATLQSWIQQGSQVLTITGMGGIGKTALALKLVEAVQGQFKQVVWRSLSPDSRPKQLLSDLSIFLGARSLEQSNSQDPNSQHPNFQDPNSQDPNSQQSDSQQSDSQQSDFQQSDSQQSDSQPSDSLPFSTDTRNLDPASFDLHEQRLKRLLRFLRAHRVLLVLDAYETVFAQGQAGQEYVQDAEQYRDLLKQLSEVPHRSCVILTSREKPRVLCPQEGAKFRTRNLTLQGLDDAAVAELMALAGVKQTPSWIHKLNERYRGNSLALKIAATTINQALFQGSIELFLAQDILLFDQLRGVLKAQFEHLPPRECEVIYWLAINREPVELVTLQQDLVDDRARADLVYSLRSLEQRFLVEVIRTETPIRWRLQPVVLEYVTQRLVKRAYHELKNPALGKQEAILANPPRGQVLTEFSNTEFSNTEFSNRLETSVLHSNALLKASSPEFIRQAQIRHIILPVLNRLVAWLQAQSRSHRSVPNLEQYLQQKLQVEQQRSQIPSYTGGNLVNLLAQVSDRSVLEQNLSGLALWQADFRPLNLRKTNLSNCDLKQSRFADTLSNAFSVEIATILGQKTLLAGDCSGVIHLWSDDSGEKQLEWLAHLSWVRSLAVHPHRPWLLTGGDDSQVKLWCFRPDLQTYQPPDLVQTILQSDWIYDAAFSPDGQHVAWASGNQLCLWRLEPWECSWQQCHDHEQSDDGSRRYVRIRALAFSPDGQFLASCGEQGKVLIWAVETGRQYRALSLPNLGWVGAIAFMPDGHTLISGGADGLIRLWDWQSAQMPEMPQTSTLQTPQTLTSPGPERLSPIRAIAIDPGGRSFAVARDNGHLGVWDVSPASRESPDQPTADYRTDLTGHSSRIWALQFDPTPGATRLLSGGDDQSVRLWNTDPACLLQTFKGHPRRIRDLALVNPGAQDPQEMQVVTGGDDHSLNLWNLGQGDCVCRFEGHQGRVWSLALYPPGPEAGRWLASASDDCTVRLWDLATGECLRTLTGHEHWVRAIAFSPDGRWLASGGDDQTIRLWDLQTEQVTILTGHTHWVRAIAFSPDGKCLASGGDDQVLRRWEVASGTLMARSPALKQRIRAIAFHPDGKTLVAGQDDGQLALWALAQEPPSRKSPQPTPGKPRPNPQPPEINLSGVTKPSQLCHFPGHRLGIKSLAFDQSGEMLVSGGDDQQVLVWNTQTWQAQALRASILNRSAASIRAVALSANGQVLITGGQDDRIEAWKLGEQGFQHYLTQPMARPYEGLNLTGTTGLNPAQRSLLRALGAIESTASRMPKTRLLFFSKVAAKLPF
ncbi:MAG: AAA family ATPase [Synechococcales cyanobacterium CRU_2_2]|nr:AAA family ATPase [Synechococcales cyanobacterium CRU_2_2]